MARKRATLGVIVGTRGFFNSKLAEGGRAKLLEVLESRGITPILLPEDTTPNGGAVETIDDARKVAALFNEQREAIDGVVVSLPNFGDELGIVNALQQAKLDVPVLVHAEDDDNSKVGVDQRRDAFCGKLSVCANLYQYDIPFTDTTYHTCKVDSEEFGQDIDFFVAVCRVVRGLQRARIGAVGARPAAFQTVRVSEKLLQSSGITVVPVDLSEILSAAEALDDSAAAVKERVTEMRAYGSIASHIAKENILKQAKFGVALSEWVAANDIDAAAVQCWTSIQRNYGCAACVSMSMLGNRLVPCACEVDIAGAVSMYALTLASGGPSALLDWNNNFGVNRDMCVCTHCSNYPKDFVGADIEIGELDVLGGTLGKERCFGAVKGKVKAGPMTFFRISTDDTRGAVKAYVGEGEFTDDAYGMDGGIAVCHVDDLQSLMKFMCRNGFEHHVGMTRGYVARAIEEALESYLGWELYAHHG
ncbi:MAG: fucose isomerase [Chitinivibrionales bacterium]|nr:fucose isomerase [Chitinivibrionales bacterium]